MKLKDIPGASEQFLLIVHYLNNLMRTYSF